MNRRGFFGWVGGAIASLLGYKAVKADSRKETMRKTYCSPPLIDFVIDAESLRREEVMRKTTRPSVVLDLSKDHKPLSEEEVDRIRAEWEKEWSNPNSRQHIIVGTPGAKLDMEYQQGWDQLEGFLLDEYGISKQMIGEVESSSYSSLFCSLEQHLPEKRL